MRHGAALFFGLSLAACQQGPAEPSTDTGDAAAEAVLAAAGDSGRSAAYEANKKAKRQSLNGCAVAAISIEQDLKGLNVRSGPSKDSPVVGILHSLIQNDPHAPDAPPIPEDEAFGPSFTITAIEGQWLKIADIDPEVGGYDPAIGKSNTKRNYQGSGWVHRSRVAVDPGFHSSAYNQPDFEPGSWKSIHDNAGSLLTLTGGRQGETAELLSCKLDWIQIRYLKTLTDGQSQPVTGWFHMSPHYIGPQFCKAGDADCKLRQDMDIWDGPN